MFLIATPREIVSVFEGKTTAQGETLAKIYKGKWLKVSGHVSDIMIHNDPLLWYMAVIVSLSYNAPEPSIGMRFNRTWRRQFSALQKGDVITAVGKIREVARYYIQLKGCELIQIGEQQGEDGTN
jgi:hypothetical protein